MVAMSYRLHSSLVTRLGVLAEFQQRLAVLQKEAEVIGKELLKSAPAQVREFLENDGVVENLIRYGQSSTKIVFGDAYGFIDSSDVVDKLRRLGEIWEENVVIKVHPAEGRRIEVSFTARTPFA